VRYAFDAGVDTRTAIATEFLRVQYRISLTRRSLAI
jgi:hypothetical protein